MRSNFLIALTFAFSACAGISVAGDANAYKASDIIKHMVMQKKVAEKTLAARAVCIGSDEECDAAMEQPAGFDLVINFAKDSADLTDEAKARLDEVASALKDSELAGQKFRIEGFTDALGTDNYNDKLSQERADSVSRYLVEKQIEPTRLSAIGLGKQQPRFNDPFDPENRRVELKLRFGE